MRNLRKLTAAVLAVAITLTSMTAAFAATDVATVNGEKATVLNELGLYAGVSTTEFDPDLGAGLTRQQATVMLLKMFGMADKANALTDEEVTAALEDYTDADKVSSWAKKAIAYAVSNKIMSGIDGTVAPNAPVTGAQYATLIVKTMGYDVADYKESVAQLSKLDGSTVKDEFAEADLTRDNAVGYMYGALTAKTKEGTTVIANLVAENASIAAAAEKAGLYTPVVAKTVDVDTVAALNSKMVEVSLKEAATAADATAAKFAVKDAAGKAVNVASTVLAPWSDKAILVTLEADTAAGTLYTLTFGDKSFNFGGKAVDTAKPGAPTVAATDANEVTVTFDEAVKMETLKVTVAESYGSKTALAVNGMKYDGSNKIVLSVGDMKDATLYKAIITDVTDLAGNQIDTNKAEVTFVGKAKSTDALKFATDTAVTKAKANFCDEVAVAFNVNVDPTTLTKENFTITEKYGTKAAVAVTAVKVAKKDDLNTAGAKVASDSDGRKVAILTVEGTMKDATLYEIKFSNLKTLYGVAQSTTSDDYTTTFVGLKKPTDAVELDSLNIGASSNTSFTIKFKQKMDKTLAETLTNYTLAEAYGSKTALSITKAELQSNGVEVKFTTAAMNTVLYKLTISNLKDIYGNSIKTADSANVVSVAGKAVASKIDKIKEITRTAPGGGSTVTVDGNTQIVVTFNGNVGSNATDVSLYTIDKGIGYPAKAVKVDGTGNEDKVVLTIGKTSAGTSYQLTVKGLLNADGVVMGTDGATASFAGKGNAYTKPKMQAVMATDKQTIKVYFDRSVESSDIKGAGKIWDEKSLVAGKLQYKASNGSLANIPTNVAWKDPDNANVLVVRTNAADTFKSTTSYSQFVLDGTASSLLDSDNDNITFASNDSDVAKPQISAVMATDRNTMVIYFDQAVELAANASASAIFSVGTKELATDSDNEVVTVSNSAPVKVDDKTYKITTSTNMDAKTYYLRVSHLPNITDKSGFFNLKPTKDNGAWTSVQFGGSSSDNSGKKITDVSVMMADKSTIKVYYPERMDKNTVTNVANYMIYKNSDGTTPADNISVPSVVVYDADTNTATLYLSGATIGGAANNNIYYLGIKDEVANEVAVRFIKDDKSVVGGKGVLVSFAASTSDDAKPSIKNVAVDLDNNKKITVEFDEAVSTSRVVEILNGTVKATNGNQIVINGAEWNTPDNNANLIPNLFTITESTTTTALTITSIKKVSNTKFEIVITTDIDPNKSYQITIGDTKDIYNLGGTQIETASDKIQKFVFTAVKAASAN